MIRSSSSGAARRTLLAWGFALAATANFAHAQSLALATDAAGTTVNTIGSGMAKVIAQGAGVNVAVRPFAGPDAWLPLLGRNEIQLGAISSFTAWESYAQKGAGGAPVIRNMRLLQSGSGSLYVDYLVLAKSGIEAVKDLKGKRVSSAFGGHSAVINSIGSTLAGAGLSWKDVVPVPVVGIVNGIDALVSGRLDATWAALGQPQVREAHAKVGVRYLPLENSPKALELVRQIAFPGAQLVTIPTGTAPGVDRDTPMMTYDSYLVATEQMSPETVRKVLSALWDRNAELVATHRNLAGFTRDKAVTASVVIPYHPAAIAFYKEKGVWNDAAEKSNAAALAQ
jgi:TRAP transporter TAXI family solute receptor